MSYVIRYSEFFDPKEIEDLPKADLRRIKKAIEEKLTTHPEIFGKPLRRSLKGHWRLRVGDYRVVFRIEEKSVKIFAIGHRSVIYEDH